MARPDKDKPDIFKLLTNLNRKNRQYYRSLPEEDKKQFAPLVVMRWLSGVSDPRQIVLLNATVNPYVFHMNKHPSLLMDLCVTTTSGRNNRCQWLKRATSKAKFPAITKMLMAHYNYNETQAIDAVRLLNDDTIIRIAEDIGTQKEEMKSITKELKIRAK